MNAKATSPFAYSSKRQREGHTMLDRLTTASKHLAPMTEVVGICGSLRIGHFHPRTCAQSLGDGREGFAAVVGGLQVLQSVHKHLLEEIAE